MDTVRIQKIFEQHAASVTGKLGAGFWDLKTDEGTMLNGDDAFQACSVFKVFLLAELFRQVNAGKLCFSDRYVLQAKDKCYGSGLIRLFDDGASLTLQDYIILMMKISDNTATDILFNIVGRDNILQNVIEPLGLSKTKCDLDCKHLLSVCFQCGVGESLRKAPQNLRNTPAYVGGLELNDETSPEDLVNILRRIYLGKWVNREMDAKLLDIMRLCDGKNRITKYLPAGTAVAHKTGTCDRVTNDVGIVHTQKGNYILALLYNGNVADESEYVNNKDRHISEEVLARISRDVYNAYIEENN